MESKLPYSRISFQEFQGRAQDPSLTKYEKIGFPDNYRKGKEQNIFLDLEQKLKLDREQLKILDIGCGCSDLVDLLITNSETKKQELILVDSQEMLDLLPNSSIAKKVPGQFPKCLDSLKEFQNELDVIIVYSVLQHIILDSNPYSFIDKALGLLKSTGVLLLGDIPNNSKRNRFFESERGQKFHEEYTDSSEAPLPIINYPDTFEKIDDGLLFGILMRYRGFGFETYILPQPDGLPMASRREDIIIVKN